MSEEKPTKSASFVCLNPLLYLFQIWATRVRTKKELVLARVMDQEPKLDFIEEF